MGGLLLMGNTASIDTGIMNTKLHVFCASRFFMVTFVAQIYNIVICAYLCSKTNAISKWNLYLKYFILFMILVQAVDSLIKS